MGDSTQFAPIRACIFDVDGLLINSEDIYTQIYNKILHEYGAPYYPWTIKATQQSRGTTVSYLEYRTPAYSPGLPPPGNSPPA
jgi:beta-phosphoglucomutase-like phosphatase (HAD superfamily)